MAELRKCPNWALSMVENYRAQFKTAYGTESKLTDDQIWDICETVFDDTSKEEEDAARVEEMCAMEA